MTIPSRKYMLLLTLTAVVIAVVFIFHAGLFLPEPSSYDRTTVAFEDKSTNDQQGVVTARVANTTYTKYIGLSRTKSLDEGEGMLFVHDTEGECRYAMRGMDIPIDMIFVDGDQKVTDVHTAQPSRGLTGLVWYETHTATCQWAVETPAGWSNKHNISEGDVLVGVDQPLSEHSSNSD